MRFLYKIAFPFLKIYWFTFRPQTFGVKAVLFCGDEFLMIKNTYGKGGWTFPGGGIKKGENPDLAIRREIEEELGISPGIIYCGEIFSEAEYKKDKIYVFKGEVEKDSKINPSHGEVSEIKWFNIKNAEELSSLAQSILRTTLS